MSQALALYTPILVIDILQGCGNPTTELAVAIQVSLVITGLVIVVEVTVKREF